VREMWRETIFVMLADLALKICSSVEASALEIAGIGRVGARLMQLMQEIRIFRPKVYCILAKKQQMSISQRSTQLSARLVQ